MAENIHKYKPQMFSFFLSYTEVHILPPIALGNSTKIDCLSGSRTCSFLKHNRADSDQLVGATERFL